MRKCELLVPVGNFENLLYAIHYGADAVYLGGKKFGARAFSNNFDDDEMIKASKLCHLYGVKMYVTVNTMIYNDELDMFIEYIKFLYKNNIDALIMQDIGLIKIVRKLFPDLDIHVSTQAHNYRKESIEYYKNIGCTRVVFDRESSLDSINNINVDIEKEVFVYGALCISYSGNCLFSALNGGRSANKGKCVGSCRLPYKLSKNGVICDDGYLLSTKDLNTLDYLKEILDSGIDSLKIEGRMKSKEYVAIVTKTYRKLIDNYYDGKEVRLTKKDLLDLKKVYNRKFTEGYLFGANNIINSKTSNHQGVEVGSVVDVNNKKITIKSTDNIYQGDAIRFINNNKGMYLNILYNSKGLLTNQILPNELFMIDNKFELGKDIIGTKINKTIDKILIDELNNYKEKKVPIIIEFNTNGEIATMVLNKDDLRKEYSADIVMDAINQPLSKDRIIEQLCKTGNTPFEVKNTYVNLDRNIFINIKDLNELRRNAFEDFQSILELDSKNVNDIYIENISYTNSSNTKINVYAKNEEQIKLLIDLKVDSIYINDYELYLKYKNKYNIYYVLPRVIDDTIYENEKLLCSDFSSLIKYSKSNDIKTNYSLNIANEYSIKLCNDLGSHGTCLSLESDIERILAIRQKKNVELFIYGKPELMLIKNNIFNIIDEDTKLIDVKNQEFPVIVKDNYTYIYDCKNINYIDDLFRFRGFNSFRIDLFNESINEIKKIIEKVRRSF